MHLDQSTPVGQFATEFPLATRVFDRYRIDFCCGGATPLAQACADRGVDADQVLEEIRTELIERHAFSPELTDALLRGLVKGGVEDVWGVGSEERDQ